jgi:hypothetical protein
MASRKNRRTLKRQSKRIKGGIFEYFYNSTPQPQKTTTPPPPPPPPPASTGSSWSWPSFSLSSSTTQAGQGQVNQGGKRMRKTSKRQSR